MEQDLNQKHEDEFEVMLAGELREMAEVEPREGFAARLQAAVFEADGSASEGRGWLWRGWALGAVAAGVMMAVMMAGRQPGSEVPAQSKVMQIAGSSRRESGMREQKAASGREVGSRPMARLTDGWQHPRDAKRRAVVALAEPKLDVFPAVTQREDMAFWTGGRDLQQGQALHEVPVTAFRALAELQEMQAGKLEIARISIPALSDETKEESR